MLATTALLAVACSSETNVEENEETVEAVEYTLDAENSSLRWAANMGPDYGHKGTVNITEGSLTMEGDALTSGSFVIDMNSIVSTDLEDPKAGVLAGHLTGTMVDEDHPVDMFFNTPKFPQVTVTLGDYADGKLGLTLDIVGKKLEQEVDATLTADENGASIKGDFGLDMTSLMLPGLQPNPEDGSGINPVIDFNLDVKLKK